MKIEYHVIIIDYIGIDDRFEESLYKISDCEQCALKAIADAPKGFSYTIKKYYNKKIINTIIKHE